MKKFSLPKNELRSLYTSYFAYQCTGVEQLDPVLGDFTGVPFYAAAQYNTALQGYTNPCSNPGLPHIFNATERLKPPNLKSRDAGFQWTKYLTPALYSYIFALKLCSYSK